ncbi:MAG: ParB/RepB/Spo0J family partition protein, partial [Oscillibacter sp.]|nr:ParB/RepB/Spo0J family partition protein [Oscillibacter sp.]
MAEKTLTMIPVSQLYPHPDNPRKNLGDLTELSESIRYKGVMQNLTVIPAKQVSEVWNRLMEDPDRTDPTEAYVVLIGHRRMAAAKLAGMGMLPCMVADMPDPKDQISIMLVENMQRTDLTPYEQAQSFQMMLDMGGTVEEISRKSGFSTTTVRQRLKMAELDGDTLQKVSDRQIALSDFDRLAQIEDITRRNKVLESIGTNNFDSEVQRELRRQKIQANLPMVKKLLKQSKLKVLKSSERYCGKYNSLNSFDVEDWSEGTVLQIPKKAEFYYLDTYGDTYAHVTFYEVAKRAKAEQKPPEQAEKERRIREAWTALKEASSLAHSLRSQFVEGLTINSKSQPQMLAGAMTQILLHADYHGIDYDAVSKILGVASGVYGGQRLENLLNGYNAAQSAGDRTVIPRLIYAAFADSEKPAYSTSYQSDYPAYQKNLTAETMYDWLISLGYEPSDEERSLRDGTHPA